MLWPCLLLIPVALAVSLPATAIVRALSRRFAAFDSGGVPGQVKAQSRKIPNTGGIAIFIAIAGTMLGIIACANVADDQTVAGWFGSYGAELAQHLPGIRAKTNPALLLVACLAILHLLGLVDDRKPLGPFVKLAVMAIPAAAVVIVSDTRLLTLLDAHVGGTWLSILLTLAWLLVVTNAMNFMDNMDGLSGGVGTIAAGCFLAAALYQQQWFVAASLAVLIGALLGFLVFNSPPATIFMGDGGSLVVGFLLGFLTIRTTYYDPATFASGPWYSVLMPLIVLAVPVYDFLSVLTLRLSQGRSPFVGDMQHLSHRLVRLGLSKAMAVAVICGFTAVTGMGAIFLGRLPPWQAVLVGAQTALMLIVLALFEVAAARGSDARGTGTDS